MTNQVNRPATAPSTIYIKPPETQKKDDRCLICFRKIFAGAYTLITVESSDKMPICSMECFAKYTNTESPAPPTDKKLKVPFKPPMPKLDLTAAAALSDTHTIKDNTKENK